MPREEKGSMSPSQFPSSDKSNVYQKQGETHAHTQYSTYMLLILRFELGVGFLSALCLYDPL